MIRFFEVFLPVIMCMTLLFPMAHALTINIDVSGIVSAVNGNTQSNASAINNNTTTLNSGLLGLPTGIMSVFTDQIKNSMRSFNNGLLSLTKDLLSMNPDPTGMMGWWQAIVTVISSLYLIVFLIIGFQFLLSGNNIQKREEAKDWLKKAIIMVIAVSVSFYLYTLILNLSTGITNFLWMSGFEQFFDNSIYATSGILSLVTSIGAVGIALLTLFLRYLFLLAGVVLFPIGIFLYLTPKLKSWGKIIFNFLGLMLAIQLLDMIILIATQQVLLQLAGKAGTTLIFPLGFTIIALANSVAIIYALLSSANSISQNAPMVAVMVNAAVGNVAGAVGGAVQKPTGAVS